MEKVYKLVNQICKKIYLLFRNIFIECYWSVNFCWQGNKIQKVFAYTQVYKKICVTLKKLQKIIKQREILI